MPGQVDDRFAGHNIVRVGASFELVIGANRWSLEKGQQG